MKHPFEKKKRRKRGAACRLMYFKMLTASLLRRKSRMLVTLLAVAVGSTILSGLLTIYYDIPRQLEHEFRSYGANLIVLPKDSRLGIREDELRALRAQLPPDRLIGMAAYRYKNVKVNEQPYRIAATDLREAHKNSPYWLIKGDLPSKEGDVMIGNDLARNIGLKVGDRFNVAITADQTATAHGNDKRREKGALSSVDVTANTTERSYTVASIVVTGGAEDSFIFMSPQDLQRLDRREDGRCDVAECSVVGSEAEVKALSEQIQKQIPSLMPRPAKRLTASQDLVLEKLKSLIWLVTIIVLILTMISVSTTMMAVVTERRKEIALKKALGAGNREVVAEFLGEGALLGFLGGMLGSIFGYFFAQRVSEEVFARAIAFHWILPPLTIVLAMLITVLASSWPVRKTVEVKPALVLKGE